MPDRKTENSKVSVIIPVLNESERIANAIARAWKAGADEVLVADGGSDDGTAQIATDSKCRYLATGRGRAIQQNAGAAAATCELLLFLHADNWLEENAIDQIRDICASPQVLHGAFRQHIAATGSGFRTLEWSNARRVLWFGLPYGDQGIFVRRRIFEECGGFPPTRLMEDLLLAKHLRRRSWPHLLPGPLHVDARRWKRYGILRQTLQNWLLLTAYQCGVSPDRLADFYARHDAKD